MLWQVLHANVLLFFVNREEEDQTPSFFEVLPAEAEQPFEYFFSFCGLDLSLVVLLPLAYSFLVHSIHQVLLVLLHLLRQFLLSLFLVLLQHLALLSLLLFLLLVQLLLLELLFGELFRLLFFGLFLSMWLGFMLLGCFAFFFLLGDCPAHRPDPVRRVGDYSVEEFSFSESESGAVDSYDVGHAELILLKIEVNFRSEQLELLFFTVVRRFFIDSPDRVAIDDSNV